MVALHRWWSTAHSPVPGVSRRARWAAVAVPLLVLPSSLWRIFIGRDPGGRGDVPAWLPMEAYAVLLSVLSEVLAFAAVGLVARWGETVPRWLPGWGGRRVPVAAAVLPAAFGAVLLTVLWTAAAFAVVTGHKLTGQPLPDDYPTRVGGWWSVVFVVCYAPLLLWGPLLGALTVWYSRRRASSAAAHRDRDSAGRLVSSRMNTTDAGDLPVASPWFTFTVLDERLTLIQEPHVRGLLRANIWHLRGHDRDVLIDCGLGVTALAPLLRERFGREPVLILTHAHLDHMGSAHEFSHVWAHPLEPVGQPAPGSLYGPVLAAHLGLKETLPPVLLTARPHGDYDIGTYRVRPATRTRALTHGDRLDLGDHAVRVLHLPGHSPGSIALFDESDGTLFSGDVVYDDTLLDSLPGSDPEQYARSLRRLRNLPVRLVRPGHGDSFGPDRLRQLVDDYLRPGPYAN